MKMKNILFIAITAVLLFSCNKLTEKNIRGNWQVMSHTINGQNITPSVPTYWTFNEAPEAFYVQDSSGTLYYANLTYSLNKKDQILTITIPDSTGSIIVPYAVEKNGRKMTWNYIGNSSYTETYELELSYPDY